MPRTKAFDETEVLEKAMNIFWKKGYNATSMDDLVTCMGINRASLYDTYGDKKKLYLAALKHYQQEGNRENGHIKNRLIQSPKAQLIAILEHQLDDSLTDSEQKGCMLANATSEMALLDADILKFVKDNLYNVELTFKQLIEQGQTLGEFNSSLSPATVATFLTNYLHGFRVVSKTKPDATKMKESLALALSVLG
jgi:TetR/AcrR family transcriptional regulator, transcriptional repressor for nem operon